MNPHRFLTGRRVVVVAAVAIATVVAGCGGSSSSSSGSSSAAATAKPKGGPLTVWLGGILAQATPGSGYRKWWDAQVKQFEAKYPGTKINTVLLNQDGVKQNAQYRAAFGAGKGPDFAMMYPSGFTTGFGPSLLDLRETAPKVLAQYPAQTLQFGCPKFDCSGSSPEYLAPYDVSGWILAYNKAAFKKAGVTAPFKSWDDLVAAGQKLKAAGYVPYEMGNRDGYISDAYLAALQSSYIQPSDIAKVLKGELKLTDPKFVQPLQTWANLYKQGLVNQDACSLEALASQRPFFAGKAASVASYDYANLYKQLKGNLGVMGWPAVTGAPDASGAGQAAQVGQGWVIPKGSHNVPLAVALLAQVTSAQAQTEQFKVAGSPPANPKASTEVAPDPVTGQAAKMFQGAKIPNFDAVLPLQTQTTYFKETNLALCGKESPQQATQNVQNVFDRENR